MPLLYLIVLLEGYVVLATELLAVRLLIPFVGSGTEVVAIVVAGVLLPLTAGYHAGGHRAVRQVRKQLLRNILSAMGMLMLALSLTFLEPLFDIFTALHIPRLWQAIYYVTLFLAYPIFLLAQTVPLISHYFRARNLSRHTGRMLFFSTAGSFLGSLLSALVLMNWIGVHGTVIVTMGLLALLVLLLMNRRHWFDLLIALMLLGGTVALNHPSLLAARSIVSNNAYNMVTVENVAGEPGNRAMNVNRSTSSKFARDPAQDYPYVHYIDQIFLQPLATSNPPRDILILGAGGFTMGWRDPHNHYTYVDIDPALKRVAERDFLKQKLGPNKQFEPLSARAFLRQSQQHFDLIVIDTYTHVYSVPMETTTVEFLAAVKAHLKPGGIVVANIAGSPNFDDRFTRRYSNGFNAVFPHAGRQVIDAYNPWQRGTGQLNNLLFIYYDSPDAADTTRYSDDRNRYFLDR